MYGAQSQHIRKKVLFSTLLVSRCMTSYRQIVNKISRLSQISGHNTRGCSRHLKKLLCHLPKKAFPFQGGLPVLTACYMG